MENFYDSIISFFEYLDHGTILGLPALIPVLLIFVLSVLILPKFAEKINIFSANYRLPEDRNPNALEKWWSGFLFSSFTILRTAIKTCFLAWILLGMALIYFGFLDSIIDLGLRILYGAGIPSLVFYFHLIPFAIGSIAIGSGIFLSWYFRHYCGGERAAKYNF